MGRIEKGFQAAAGGFAVEAVITPLWGQSPGLGWPPAVMKAPGESPQSLCCCSWHT